MYVTFHYSLYETHFHFKWLDPQTLVTKELNDKLLLEWP